MELIEDIDGNQYRIIELGKLKWTIDNFRGLHYSNGNPILTAISDSEYLKAGLSGLGAVCNINNDDSNAKPHGRLYNWYAVHDNRGIAPLGWRVPTDNDWNHIESELQRIYSTTNNWEQLLVDYNLEFSGSRGINGAFGGFGKSGYWWRQMPHPEAMSENWGRRLNIRSDGFEEIDGFKRFGFSVRFVTDK